MKTTPPTDVPPGDTGSIVVTATTGTDPSFDLPEIAVRFETTQNVESGTATPGQKLMFKLFKPQELYLPVTGLWSVKRASVTQSRGKWTVLDVTQVPGRLRLVVCCTSARENTALSALLELLNLNAVVTPEVLKELRSQLMEELLDEETIEVTLEPEGGPPAPPPPPIVIEYEDDETP